MLDIEYSFLWDTYLLGDLPEGWDGMMLTVARREEAPPRTGDFIAFEGARFKVVSVERDLDDPSRFRVSCNPWV